MINNDIELIHTLENINTSVFIPILGQEEYLQIKSSEYGWFKSESYLISFYYDVKFIFKKLVFSTDIILLRRDEDSEENKKIFINNIVQYIIKNKLCDFISKAQSNVVFSQCPEHVTCVPWGTYEINLNMSENQLFQSFNGKCRNIIRKAIKSNVQIKETKDYTLVYNNIREMFLRQKLINYPSESYIENIIKVDGLGKLFIAVKDNIIQGSLVMLYDNERSYAMYAGSIKFPEPGSLDLLHFEAMKFSSSQKISYYDFVGTRINIIKGSKQEGINKFKKKFNPNLRQGFAFRKIIKPGKYLLYLIILKIYMILNCKIYKDPITEIMETN